MFVHPQFDPIAFSVGPLSVHWYGLMYLVGFALFWFLGTYRAKKDAWRSMSAEKVEDLLFYGVLGVILGGRLGYCLFYQPDFYLAHPSHIIRIWDGGMSAHGGIIGVDAGQFVLKTSAKDVPSLIFFSGLIVITVLHHFRIRGGVLIGIFVSALIAFLCGKIQLSGMVRTLNLTPEVQKPIR